MSKTTYLESTDLGATATTFIYCCFAQMWAAEQLGIEDVYINWEEGHIPPRALDAYVDNSHPDKNQFNRYFIQPKTQNPMPRNESKIWTWQSPNWDSGFDVAPHNLMAQPLSVIREYYQKHLHFNDETNRKGQLIADKYNIDFAKTIGITWRGTDVYLDGRPRMPIETYFPFIDDILEKEPHLRIAATAEEESILDPLLARYPNAFKIEEFLSSPFESKHNPERLTQVSGYEKGLQPALMVWLFSKCAHYIKNRSSTGAVASWLSNGRIVNLFHPETLGFPANTQTVEIEGRQYTPDNKLIG